MDGGGASWSILTIVGPILLAAVLLWAVLQNRKRTRAERDLTEQATRDLYDKDRKQPTRNGGA